MDADNERMVTGTPAEVLQFLILQKRDDVIIAFEDFHFKQNRGVFCRPDLLKAKLNSLWLEIGSAMRKEYEKKKGNKILNIERGLKSVHYDDLLSAFLEIDSWLYDKKLTQFDSRGGYDSTNVEVENRRRNL